jgi:hypothetical protein
MHRLSSARYVRAPQAPQMQSQPVVRPNSSCLNAQLWTAWVAPLYARLQSESKCVSRLGARGV